MTIKLSECVEILDNNRVPLSSLERENLEKIYPYYGAQGIIDFVDSYIFDGDYILVAEDGNNLKSLNENIATWVTGKFWVNNHAHILGSKKDYNLKYIYYLINSMDLRGYITGSAQPKLNQKNLANIELNLPSKKVQDRIANILKSIDDKFSNNNKINKLLEDMIKDIYNYWFLQYEFPNENGKPYKSSGGKMIWNKELKKEIPDGWKTITLSEIIKNDKGGDWGKDKKEGNYICNVKCIRGADLPGLLGKEQLKAPQRYILEKNSYKKLEQGDLIIEISGGSPTQSTGRIGYINQNTIKRFNHDLITSNFCKAISLENKNMQYWFYMLWQQLYDNDVLFKYEGKTTGIKNLLFDMLCKDYLVVLPDIETLKSFNNKVSILFETIQKNCKENENLSNLRDFLLPLLMSGQVGFKDEDK